MILNKWWLVDGYEVVPSSYVRVFVNPLSQLFSPTERTIGAHQKCWFEAIILLFNSMLDFVCQDFNNCAISTGEWGCYSNCFLLLYIYTYDMKISTAINLGEWLLNALCVCNEWTIAISRASRIQWPFQEPKLEVPAIYKAYLRPM